VKRLCADDSGCTSVKVGHRQALIPKRPNIKTCWGVLLWKNEKTVKLPE
jgi:hypothetical protein